LGSLGKKRVSRGAQSRETLGRAAIARAAFRGDSRGDSCTGDQQSGQHGTAREKEIIIYTVAAVDTAGQ